MRTIPGSGRRGRGTARDHDHPRPLARHRREMQRKLRRRAVEEVAVLDCDQRRLRDERGEERRQSFVQLGPAVLLGEHVDFGGRLVLDTECNADQREPWRELRRARVDHLAQATRDVGLCVVAPEAQPLAQELAPHGVRSRRRVRLADRMPDAESGGLAAQRVEETRLADAGLAADLHERALAFARGDESLAERCELGIASDEGQRFLRGVPRA